MQESQQMYDTNRIYVTVSEDELQAYMTVSTPGKGTNYTKEQLMQALAVNKVVFGIQEDKIELLLGGEHYDEELCVAQGVAPVDGQDGYYEFFFETKKKSGPRILKDGSVDYSVYGDLQMVKEGDKLAYYHPAVSGQDGTSVLGICKLAKHGKELAKLKGRNFVCQEDGLTYIAEKDGIPSYDESAGRISIEEVMLVEGDVCINTGNIEFVGDIHVRGNVVSGMTIKSLKGGIIVDGFVEGAVLIAPKDIVLQNGMQGNGRGKIICQGSVSGKFFEQTVIEAKGYVNANSILNCEVKCGEDVIVSGRLGVIVGGRVNAMRQIQATMIGNLAEAGTNITCGVVGDLFSMLGQAEKQMNEIEEGIAKLSHLGDKIKEMLETEKDETKIKLLREKAMEITRAKVERNARITELIKKKDELLSQMEKANNARVIIQKSVYPGTVISINGVSTAVKEIYTHVEYMRRGAGITVGKIGE